MTTMCRYISGAVQASRSPATLWSRSLDEIGPSQALAVQPDSNDGDAIGDRRISDRRIECPRLSELFLVDLLHFELQPFEPAIDRRISSPLTLPFDVRDQNTPIERDDLARAVPEVLALDMSTRDQIADAFEVVGNLRVRVRNPEAGSRPWMASMRASL